MNNNHYYRLILTGKKNHHNYIEHNYELNKDVQSNKMHKHKNLSLLQESSVFEYSHKFNHNSIDVCQCKEKSDSTKRVNTEQIRSKFQLQIQSQRSNFQTAYFPYLKERAKSLQKNKIEKISFDVDIDGSPNCIRELKKSIDFSQSQQNKQRNKTLFQQRTIEKSKLISQLDHFNQQEIMQFSFGLQDNRIGIEKYKFKFPKDIFLGDVRKIKKILQQQ